MIRRLFIRSVCWSGCLVVLCPTLVLAEASERPRSLTDSSLNWPGWAEFFRILSLSDYNTRVVVMGTTLLGLAAGVIGTFSYLRKRALMGDALSHATLPGIAIVFLLMGAKNLPMLLLGATISGVVGVIAVIGLRTIPRIKEDAAIGIVLSVFFGLGMVLFGLIQQMHTGNEAGLSAFIYGSAAAMLARDAQLIGVAAVVVVLASLLFFKEFRVVCFDQAFASAQGYRVALVDLIMMGLVVLTTVVGLQAVGLILIVALLIIPAAAARFWTDELRTMTLIAGIFGAVACYLGATISAMLPRLPTGAVIVLSAGGLFLISMMVAPRRGIIAAAYRRQTLRHRIAYQHVLRAIAEYEEQYGEDIGMAMSALIAARSWAAPHVRRVVARAARRGAILLLPNGSIRLTSAGRAEANRILRNHRLWEIYLIRHAELAPSHVDRDADEVEHVLSEAIIGELERVLDEQTPIPPSPHAQERPA